MAGCMLQVVLCSPFGSLYIYLLVCSCGNNDDFHHSGCVFDFIDDSDANIPEFNLLQVCEIGSALISERFPITALMNGERVLTYLINSFEDDNLSTSIQLFQILFSLFQIFNLPAHSITTSPAAARSASLIPSSDINSSREDVEEESSLRRLVASRSKV